MYFPHGWHKYKASMGTSINTQRTDCWLEQVPLPHLTLITQQDAFFIPLSLQPQAPTFRYEKAITRFLCVKNFVLKLHYKFQLNNRGS